MKLRNNGKKNLIFMVSDGLGVAGVSLVRSYMRHTLNDKSATLVMDRIHVGSVVTSSESSRVTDSAAGATAYSCGIKVPNYSIAMDKDGNKCKTVMEKAADDGYLTGLVVTAAISDATPAAFTSHSPTREDRDLISLNQLGENSNNSIAASLMFGAGGCLFKNSSTGLDCSRKDKVDIEEVLRRKGWKAYHNEELMNLRNDPNITVSREKPILGLVTGNYYADYEVDKQKSDVKQMNLKTMTELALEILTRSLKPEHKGIFLLVEGSNIDLTAHNNDTPAYIHEILEYNRAMDVVLQFASKNKNILVVSVSDHETGGLTLPAIDNTEGGPYKTSDWDIEYLANINSSLLSMSRHVIKKSSEDQLSFKYFQEMLKTQLNIDSKDGIEIQDVYDEIKDAKDELLISKALARIVTRRSHVHWSTNLHTSVDVNIYAYGKHKHMFEGLNENFVIGKLLESYIMRAH